MNGKELDRIIFEGKPVPPVVSLIAKNCRAAVRYTFKLPERMVPGCQSDHIEGRGPVLSVRSVCLESPFSSRRSRHRTQRNKSNHVCGIFWRRTNRVRLYQGSRS